MVYSKYKLILEEKIKNDSFYKVIPDDIKYVANLFHENGYELYLVGGAVRDFLSGKTPKDFDLATDATPEEIDKIVAGKYDTYDVGKAFGVSRVITDQTPEGIEIATFRSDSTEGDGRRPDSVTYTDIEHDVLRRDLTINALFYDLIKKEIVDLVGGVSDLKNNIVRTVGDPAKRFEEDRLRILRVVRFAGRMNAQPDKDTYEVIKANPDLSKVSKERIRDEFVKGLKSSVSIVFYLNLCDELGLLEEILPGFTLNKQFKEFDKKHYTHTIAWLLKDNDLKKLEKELNKLTYSNDEIRYILFFVRLINLTPEEAYRLKKDQEKLNINNSEIEQFNKTINANKLIDKFVKYEITTSPQDVMDAGFKNQEIGLELLRRETDLFNKI